MPPQERGITYPEREKHPESLSDQRLGALLAAVANHEGKAGTIAQMRPDIIYSRGGLNTIANPRKLWNKTMPFVWCEGSLAPIGFVTQATTDSRQGTVVGYSITEKGLELGVALAGHVLSFSEKHSQHSLVRFLGS